LNKLIVNLKGFTSNVTTRSETLHGIDYIVAPVNMIVEGVLPGSGGPMLYPADQLRNSVNFWNNVPVTINHPQIDGNYVSARSPEVMEQFAVGHIFNTRFDAATNTLKAEAWIQKDRLQNNFENVFNMLTESNANIEISTGVLHSEAETSGDFNGVAYNTVGSDFYGDHLALLPNDVGACSWRDGCGLRVNSSTKKVHKAAFNELDNNTVETALRRYVDSLDNSSYFYYVHSVYSNWFVYEERGRGEIRTTKLFKQGYSVANDVVTPIGSAERVVEERRFQGIPDDAPSPSGISTINRTTEGDEMAHVPCCPEKVKDLIRVNAKFTQADESWLLELNEKGLESITAMATPATTTETEEVTMNVQEYVDAAPDGIKTTLNALLIADAETKAALIETITANENCTFDAAELEGFSTNQLNKMIGLTPAAATEATTETVVPKVADMAANAAIVQPVVEKNETVNTLDIPRAAWGKKE